MNVPFSCFCARNFVPKIARSAPLLGYKPSGEDGGSYSWAPGLSAEAEICNYQDNCLRIHSFEVFCITQTSVLAEYDLLKSLLGELEPRDRSSTVKDWATGGQAS